MARWIVSALGVAALGGAIAMLVALDGTTRTEPSFLPGESTWDRTRILLSRGAGGLAGSIVAGVLVMGLGGRLMMRVMAATSSDAVQGVRTDMDAVVGEVTVDGTIGFLLFVGVGTGVLGWTGRLLLRRWLPTRSVVAGVLAAAIGAGLLARGSSLLEPSSIDFFILSPTWLAVAMIIGLIVLFAMLQIVLSDRWSQSWPANDSVAGMVGLAPLAVLITMPPFALAIAAGTLVRAHIGEVEPHPDWLSTVDKVGRVVVAVGAILGALWVLAAAMEILGS